jgi:RHS repeat-associated protein
VRHHPIVENGRAALGRGRNEILPGQYYDAETGLSYNYARDYDPASDRYVESDPIGLAGGSYSTYAYANGNLLSNTDPLGLAARRNVLAST